MAEFDGPAILAVLARHQVDYLLIGGFAAAAQGSPIPTTDVDIVPATDRDNYVALSAALTELDARVRTSGVEPLNLTTRYGDLDITVLPAGTQGYDDLRRDAIAVEIRGVRIKLASLADIVRSKEAAGRDKDRRALPVLRELVARQMRERRGR